MAPIELAWARAAVTVLEDPLAVKVAQAALAEAEAVPVGMPWVPTLAVRTLVSILVDQTLDAGKLDDLLQEVCHALVFPVLTDRALLPMAPRLDEVLTEMRSFLDRHGASVVHVEVALKMLRKDAIDAEAV